MPKRGQNVRMNLVSSVNELFDFLHAQIQILEVFGLLVAQPAFWDMLVRLWKVIWIPEMHNWIEIDMCSRWDRVTRQSDVIFYKSRHFGAIRKQPESLFDKGLQVGHVIDVLGSQSSI